MRVERSAMGHGTVRFLYSTPDWSFLQISPGVWAPPPSSNCTGIIGELVSRRADIALFPLTRTASRLAVIDCTFSYYDSGLALLVSWEGAGAF
jgi:hypothetical protein